jgi:hypothetical protein
MLAVAIKGKGDDGENRSNTADQGAPAANAQLCKHLIGEKWGCSPTCTPGHRVGGDGGGGVHEIGVDEVVEEGDKDPYHAHGETDAGQGEGDPVNWGTGKSLHVFTGPGQPEIANGKADATNHGQHQAILGLHGLATPDPLRFEARSYEDDCTSQDGADNRANQRQFPDTGIPAAHLLEDNGVDGEEHVEKRVDDGNVDGAEEGDGVEEDDPGPDECHLVYSDQRHVRVLHRRFHLLVAGYLGLPDPFGLVHQNGGCICLGNGEHEEGRDTAEPQEHVETPAPVLLEVQEPRDQRAQCRPNPDDAGEAGHGDTALDGIPQIGQHTRRIGQRRRDKGASQEAADQETAKVGGPCAQEVEDEVEQEGDVEDDAPAIEFAEGREEERSGNIAKQEERQRQSRSLGRDAKPC